jgi:hypothetical protein
LKLVWILSMEGTREDQPTQLVADVVAGKISAAVASLVEATCSKEAEETMEFAAAMVVVEPLEDAKGVVVSTTPTVTTTIVKGLHPMKSPCVRYASKEGILLLNVGTGSKKIMCQIRDWWLRPQTLMGWTQIGTWILVPPTM